MDSLPFLPAATPALRRSLLATATLLAFAAMPVTAVDIELPSLGDASSAAVSPVVERKLGGAWLRMFRGQVKTVEDALLQDYLEQVVFDLATHSELTDARLHVVIVDNETLNAFAVPGGVVGLNNGLLLAAQHEDELASVIAHELAHLSQRHYARSVEEAKRNAVPNALIVLCLDCHVVPHGCPIRPTERCSSAAIAGRRFYGIHYLDAARGGDALLVRAVERKHVERHTPVLLHRRDVRVRTGLCGPLVRV